MIIRRNNNENIAQQQNAPDTETTTTTTTTAFVVMEKTTTGTTTTATTNDTERRLVATTKNDTETTTTTTTTTTRFVPLMAFDDFERVEPLVWCGAELTQTLSGAFTVTAPRFDDGRLQMWATQRVARAQFMVTHFAPARSSTALKWKSRVSAIRTTRSSLPEYRFV